MKFGINFFPSFRPSDSSTADYYQQCITLAECADRLGFHSVKTVEHSLYDYGGHSPNPSVFLSALAVRTQRIRVMTGAVIPAFHHPAHLAGDLSMLDNMSRGRLDAGFGRAFLPKEFEVFGDRVQARGQFWHLDDVHLMPRPFQQPHPPIWIAAISSEESFTYAARNGFNVMIVPYAGKPGTLQEYVKMYRKMWADSGHAPGTEQVQMSQFCCISPSRDQAHKGFERIMKRYLETFAEAVQSWEGKTSDQYPGYDKMVANILAMTPQKIIENKAAYVGTPQDMIEQVQANLDQFGVVEPSMQINFGGNRTEDALQTLELIAKEVMPHFAHIDP